MVNLAANRMRVQLQQQSGGRTIHHGSIVLEDDTGVTVARVVAALRRLQGSGAVPAREHAGAEAALANALRWVRARPPVGASGRYSKSFYFDRQHPGTSWRFDIEGLAGTNLVR